MGVVQKVVEVSEVANGGQRCLFTSGRGRRQIDRGVEMVLAGRAKEREALYRNLSVGRVVSRKCEASEVVRWPKVRAGMAPEGAACMKRSADRPRRPAGSWAGCSGAAVSSIGQLSGRVTQSLRVSL